MLQEGLAGLQDFTSYEEYLDSELEEQLRSMDAIDRAYHRLQLIWSFNPRRQLLMPSQFLQFKQITNPKAVTQEVSKKTSMFPELGALEELSLTESPGLHTLLYIHSVQDSGAEVSGHIDLTHRLADPGFLDSVRSKGSLCPAQGDVTFYNWASNSLRFRGRSKHSQCSGCTIEY